MASGETPPHVEKQSYSVLVVGGIGYGKSSFINSIRGEKICQAGTTWKVGETITQEVQEVSHDGEKNIFKLFDTPSIRALSSSSTFKELLKAGIHAIVIVCSIKSYPSGSSTMFKDIKELFGEDMYPYSLVVLTFGDYLDKSEGEGADEFIEANPELKEFLDKIEKRWVVFDNLIDEKSEQQKLFFSCIERVLQKNGNQPLKKIESNYFTDLRSKLPKLPKFPKFPKLPKSPF